MLLLVAMLLLCTDMELPKIHQDLCWKMSNVEVEVEQLRQEIHGMLSMYNQTCEDLIYTQKKIHFIFCSQACTMENGFCEDEPTANLNLDPSQLGERAYEDPHIGMHYIFQNMYRRREQLEMRISDPTVQRYRDIAAEVYQLFVTFSSRSEWLLVLHEVQRNGGPLPRLMELLRTAEQTNTTSNHDIEGQRSSTAMDDID